MPTKNIYKTLDNSSALHWIAIPHERPYVMASKKYLHVYLEGPFYETKPILTARTPSQDYAQNHERGLDVTAQVLSSRGE
jgi:hypothetical protein